LEGVSFYHSSLIGVDFTNAKFVDCSLGGAKLLNANFSSVKGLGSKADEMEFAQALLTKLGNNPGYILDQSAWHRCETTAVKAWLIKYIIFREYVLC
jgi:hypothetical protein